MKYCINQLRAILSGDGRADCKRRGGPCDRNRYRRFDTFAGVLERHRRTQADVRTRSTDRSISVRTLDGSHRPNDQNRQRLCPDARGRVFRLFRIQMLRPFSIIQARGSGIFFFNGNARERGSHTFSPDSFISMHYA